MLALRQYRIFGIALFDLVLGVVGMIIIFLLARWKFFPNLSVWPFIIAAVLLTVPIGIAFHIIFGVNTQLNYYLDLSNKPK